MRHVLSEEGRAALREVARERLPLAFDFDGTLAPLVDDPGAARMRDATRALLRVVALLHPCAVVSGRARADVSRRVEGVPLVAIVGNHGAEAGYGPVDGSVRNAVAGWGELARARLRGVRGVEVEDKGLSLAIHFRRARSPREAVHAIAEVASSLAGARVFRGRAVVNVVPPAQHDKGAAVAAFAARVGARRALYVGDDTTDEDAFRHASVALAIRVGRSVRSAAGWYVASQAEVDELLRALVRARRRLDGLDDRVEGLERLLGA